MFDKKVYVKRRQQLKKKVGSGLILLPGNNEAPMNYADNTYGYRQDSTFLYYFGLDHAGFTAVIDVDEDRDMIFGNDFSLDDIVWTGPQPTVKQLAAKIGVADTFILGDLDAKIRTAISQGRKIHFIPQYRYDNMLSLQNLLGIDANRINEYASGKLIKAIYEQRAIKSAEEINEIEMAIDISYDMQTLAMQMARPGLVEGEIAGFIQGIAASRGSGLSFPIIFSRHGETLHNHSHNNVLKAGDIVINDSGAETELHYASDITRTFPVSGKFTQRQREIYQIVLDANMAGINGMKPGVHFRNVHLKAALVIAEGLKELGFMKGNMKDAVNAGAHALFFPHGLGHMLGLDVHDMENLGENVVGYDEKTQRSTQFGLKSLRYAKPLQPGMIMTIEPGVYFIPQLIDKWQAEKKFNQFINYKKVNSYRDFGGIRIEDDVLVTRNGSRVLGTPIPKAVEDVESFASDKI